MEEEERERDEGQGSWGGGSVRHIDTVQLSKASIGRTRDGEEEKNNEKKKNWKRMCWQRRPGMAAAATGRGVEKSGRYKERRGAALPRAFLIEPRFTGQILPSFSHILKSNKPRERHRRGGGVCERGRAARNKHAKEVEMRLFAGGGKEVN